MKLLLHACCGPCFLGVWQELGSHAAVQPSLYYYNPNIQPEEEYELRYASLEIAARAAGLSLSRGDYRPELHHEAIAPMAGRFSERCLPCYRLRLEGTAEAAAAQGFEAFSTTLLVSPYQRHEDIIALGREIAARRGLEFYEADWRPYFRPGQERAKELGLYRQKFCGCSLSSAEAEAQRAERERQKAARQSPLV
jgi:predicted adenine nucleotide alpha hydrolase (AANH) superfamily ATPase